MNVEYVACGVVKAPEDTFCTECGEEIEYNEEVYLCTNYSSDEQDIVCHNCYHNKHR